MPVVPALTNDSYLNYSALETYMHQVEEAVPHLVKVYSIGQSSQGRDLIVAEVSNQGTGDPAQKPAIWLDGNALGGDLASSHALLAVLNRLAQDHGRDQQVTDLLDACTFYILPRMSPDGAELALTSGLITSVGRRLGFFDGLREGLVPGDVDGDGKILQMRIKDPCGQWKVSKRDDRLMLKRLPGDNQGPFYRLYREGFFDVELGQPVHLRLTNSKRELIKDFTSFCDENEAIYGGTGNVGPFSQEESRAVSNFLRGLTNVCLAISVRSGQGKVTISGMDAKPNKDKELFRLFAQKAGEILHVPVEEDNKSLDFTDWIYEELGVVAIKADAWNLLALMGFSTNMDTADESELLAVLRWIDRDRNGQGFVKWNSLKHPQLGDIEVGGWELASTWLNPPAGDLLKDMCLLFVDLSLCLASTLPHLVLGKCGEEVIGWDEPSEDSEDPDNMVPLRKITFEIINEGYLSTWVSEFEFNRREPIIVECASSDSCQIIMGKPLTELPALAGIVSVHLSQGKSAVNFSGVSETNRSILEYLVKGEGEVTISACHPKSGIVQMITNSSGDLFLSSSPSSRNIQKERPLTGILAQSQARKPKEYAPQSTYSQAPPRVQPPRAQKDWQPNAPKETPPRYAPSRTPSARPTPKERAPEPGSHEVRAVNLTQATRSKENIPAAPQTAQPKPPMSGYRPSLRSSAANPVERPVAPSPREYPPHPSGEYAQPQTSQYTPRSQESSPLIREESPLRKEAPSQPAVSGRVLGQAPSKMGTTTSNMPSRSSKPSRQSIEEIPLPGMSEHSVIKPHSLISSSVSRSSGAPQESAPETSSSPEDGLEGPPSVSKVAPLLLRRSRDE